jgi:ribonuclease Z
MDTLTIKNIHYSNHEEEINTGTRLIKLAGFSRCAYRTGFIIDSPKLGFDGGPPLSQTIKNFLITHTHADHIASLPFTIISKLCDLNQSNTNDIFTIYCPIEDKILLENYIRSLISLNCSNQLSEASLSNLYRIVGVRPNDKFEIIQNRQITQIQVFKCFHGNKPTVGYGVSIVVKKLHDEYKTLQGHEIKKLKDKLGDNIYYQSILPQIAYLCDTTERVFEDDDIFKYPIIMIECTFFLPDEIKDAIRKDHTHWEQLKPIVQSHPQNKFILFHFTQAHKDNEINDFFKHEFEINQITNVIIWIPLWNKN